MCWNADISLNTFLFTTFSLIFIYFANTYTRYKSETFQNPLVYVFVLLVVSMQLIEHFVWKNIDNNLVNSRLSRLASIVIVLQPLTLLLMVPIIHVRYMTILFYLAFIVGVTIYYNHLPGNSLRTYMSVAKNGHLKWEWIDYKGYERILLFVFLSFYVIPLMIIRNNLLFLFIIPALLISLYYYYKEQTMGTIWCWSVNLFMFYFLMEILLIKPFIEYNGLC